MQEIDGSWTEDIITQCTLTNELIQGEISKVAGLTLEIAYTWIALKLLKKLYSQTEAEWTFVFMKGENFIKSKGQDYTQLALGLTI